MILAERRIRLDRISAMQTDNHVQLYDHPHLPNADYEAVNGSVFLAGPTSRECIAEYNWRSDAVHYLRKQGFTGVIFVPEPGKMSIANSGDFTEKEYIHRWESDRLLSATYVVFWIPRNKHELLGLNTNIEFGIWLGKLSHLPQKERVRKLFIGWPDTAERMGLPRHYAADHSETGGYHVYGSLENLCEAVHMTHVNRTT